MQTRTMFVGDTYPPQRFWLTSANQTLDLRPATQIIVTFDSGSHQFGGAATPIWPPTDDAGESAVDAVVTLTASGEVLGPPQWNLQYTFADGDTSTPGEYDAYAVVAWPQGQQTFAQMASLTILTS
jgi:hypothetical protein